MWTHPYFYQNCQVRSKRNRDGLQSATTGVARGTLNHKTGIKRKIKEKKKSQITEQDRTAVVAIATYRRPPVEKEDEGGGGGNVSGFGHCSERTRNVPRVHGQAVKTNKEENKNHKNQIEETSRQSYAPKASQREQQRAVQKRV